MNLAAEEPQRQRDIIGDAFGAGIDEETRNPVGLNLGVAAAHLLPGGIDQRQRTGAEILAILDAVGRGKHGDALARPPGEALAEHLRMQGADEHADPAQRQARRDQPLAEFLHHVFGGHAIALAGRNPVGNLPQMVWLHVVGSPLWQAIDSGCAGPVPAFHAATLQLRAGLPTCWWGSSDLW